MAYVIMKQYAGFNGLEPATKGFAALSKYSLGNIGFTTSICLFQFAQLKKPMELKCNKGKLSRLHYKGAISSAQGKKLNNTEKEVVGHDFCGDP